MSHNNSYTIGSTGNPVDSSLAGLNTQETYLAFKNFSRIQLSNTMATQLPNSPGPVTISNPLGNDTVFVGGLDGSGDTPYLDSNYPGQARGQSILGGSKATFQVSNANLLQVIANRNGDIIQITPLLSQSDFQTPTNDPPPNPLYVGPLQVLSNSPLNGATGVATNTVATVVFNRAINPSFVTFTNVTVSPKPATMIVYVDPSNPDQIDIDPQGSNLATNTLYTITVTTTLQDTLGLSLSSPFTFSFTTLNTTPPDVPPTVVSTTPANNDTGVALNATVTIVMSEPVQPATVNTSTVVLQDPNTNVVAATVTLGVDNKTITLTPTANLGDGLVYTCTVGPAIKDVAGNPMTAAYVFSFTTTSSYVQWYNVSGTTPVNISSALTYFGVGERVETASSAMIGHFPRKVVLSLALSSNSVTGSVNCYHLNNGADIVLLIGSINCSQLSTTPTSVIFENPSAVSFVHGDWIGVTTHGVNTGNVIAYTSSSNAYDTNNSYTNLLTNADAYVGQAATDLAAAIYE